MVIFPSLYTKTVKIALLKKQYINLNTSIKSIKF